MSVANTAKKIDRAITHAQQYDDFVGRAAYTAQPTNSSLQIKITISTNLMNMQLPTGYRKYVWHTIVLLFY